jgi:hypothetical protein
MKNTSGRARELSVSALSLAAVGAGASWAALDRSEAVSAALFVGAAIPLILMFITEIRNWSGAPVILAVLFSGFLVTAGLRSLDDSQKPAEPKSASRPIKFVPPGRTPSRSRCSTKIVADRG